MRIHTSASLAEVKAAAHDAKVAFHRLDIKGSKRAPRAYDVILTGSATHASGFGRDYRPATWDEWGVFLAALYNADPYAYCAGVYENGGHFHWATGLRYFEGFDWSFHHRRHKWPYTGSCSVGTYTVHECACGAMRRFLRPGLTWAEFAPEPDYSDSRDKLSAALPALYSDVPCPECVRRITELRETVVHLNDHHRWTREAIADWLDTLDVDLTFPVPDDIPAHIR